MLALAACQKAEEAPTPTLDQANIAAASTLFAQPTRVTRPTPTITPVQDVELELSRVVARMEQAVLTGDVEGYLAHVWDGDPVFWTEHTRWAYDWRDHPLSVFDLTLYSIRAESADRATARLTMIWRQRGETGDGSAGGTTANVVFYRRDGAWLLGGEHWHTTDVAGFRLYYFDDTPILNGPQARTVRDYLPGLWTSVTRAFDFTPVGTVHLKMYDSPVTLQNWTRLSMPKLQQWNEPGEAIKLALGPNGVAPHESEVAREFTRFLLFEMAGGTHGQFPWWFEEGVAQYGGALFDTLSARNRMLKQVAALAVAPETADERLFAWDALAVRPDLLEERAQAATNQAFALVHYISETFGAQQRNAWIRAVAAGMTVEEACQAHLGLSLAGLDAQWRAWLPTQL